jgi:N utilization substance protein A
MEGQVSAAIKQICYEKNLEYEMVLAAVEAALAAAFRKDFGDKNTQNIEAEYDPGKSEIKIYDVKTVVEDLTEEEIEDEENELTFNAKSQIMFADAKKIKKSYKVGDDIRTELEIPDSFGRMAAQTAKQVIIQKLREAEREALFEDFKKREGTIVTGTIHRREGHSFLIDFGKVNGILPEAEQIKREFYKIGERTNVYVKSVENSGRGPEIIVSRIHSELVRVLFQREIPEISSGDIEIKNIVRDPGLRAKVAVYTSLDNLDPIGSCIGQRGSRIQTIIGELNGEKIDVIQWDEDMKKYIANALSPAKVKAVELNEKAQSAFVTVANDQLSLAIGREAQNVRLAVLLTGWAITVRGDEPVVADEAEVKAKTEVKVKAKVKVDVEVESEEEGEE